MKDGQYVVTRVPFVKNQKGEPVHMKIDIHTEDMTVIAYPFTEPLYMPYLSEMIKYLYLLDYLDESLEEVLGPRDVYDPSINRMDFRPAGYKLSSKITKYLRWEKDELLVSPWFMKEYCLDGAFKRWFVVIQLVFYEIKELIEQGIMHVEIFVDGELVKPVWGHTRQREYKITKRMIKDLKKYASIVHQEEIKKINRCELKGKLKKDNFIQVCCICNSKDRAVLKKIC